jgi:hypothetical protein
LSNYYGLSRRTPWWFHKLEAHVIEHPSRSRHIKLQWHDIRTHQQFCYLPTPNVNKTRTHDWVAVWDKYLNQAVIGHVVNKNALAIQ